VYHECSGPEPVYPGGFSAASDLTPADDASPRPVHVSVLAEEAVDALAPHPGGVFIDGTFGGGGHATRLAQRIQPGGTLLCIDRDPATQAHFQTLEQRFPQSVTWAQGTYADMQRLASQAGINRVDGILLDLGLSSFQLADAERGFSFLHDGPLDMRFDPTGGASARDLLATLDEHEIVHVLFAYGEEDRARRIARAIVRERERSPIETTGQLASIVERAAGHRPGSRIHPATKTFQALRIAVNDELGEVERGIAAGLDLLAPGGRFAVIAFHSLEDRIVKQRFAEAARGCICPRDVPVCVCGRVPTIRIVGRPIRPSASEVAANPRSRSAVLRVVERLP
jgi:16S rRNA (cytosine1402-N4)-methyltransferase